ncbi:DUF4194 domain-containing protein [Legionella fallonii]|uniref:Uncharacterized protein n=1 Tax=Legionella fallonii LLAP-10 TaxID=1212491 RepID=A0A098G2M9_9GAMM|nr:hypothetical protein [Legionella fallonii]CEG56742.1 conserved protein of unknown function [Legionella fallonii LLAP-10]
MDDIVKLGSPSALSLLASAGTTSIPGLVVGGAILAVAAAVFTYKEYKKFEEKKHKKKIEEINQLYTERLKQITVPFYGSIDGFPPVFQLNKENKYESLHYTLAEVKDIGKLLPSGGDVALVSYRESIRAALRKLKEYYFLRAKSEDEESDEVTIRVLSYLLHMIDSKCLNFLGYEYDIAYLGALTEFINEYASLGRAEHSQHFDRLKEVYANLLEAKQKLEKHKEVLSLEETVSALRDHCVQHSDLLIRTFVKMIANKSDTDLAATVNHAEIIDGILRKHYIRKEVWGIELVADHQIEVPESVFKGWLKNLSLYYLSSLSIETGQKNEKAPIYEDFFNFLKKAEDYLANRTIGNSEKEVKKLNEEIKKQLQLIAKVFKDSDNFISTVYKPSDKKFHVVHDEALLVERSRIVANFAKLIDDVISLQYVCIHLSKSIKELGEIYVKNPRHFHKIFSAMAKLCTLIQADMQTCIDDFIALQEKNKDKMQAARKEQFPNEVRSLLDSVAVGVERLGAAVKSCRKKAKKAINQETTQSVAYEMLEVVESVLGRYFKETNTIEKKSISPPVIKQKNSTEQKEQPVHAGSGTGNLSDSLPPSTSQQSQGQSQEVSSLLPDEAPLEQLKKLTQEIYSKTVSISQTEPQIAKNYFTLYDTLIVMQEKSIALMDEPDKTEQRSLKAESTLELTLSLVKKTYSFLNKTSDERKQLASSFAKEIHNILNSEENSDLIDCHNNSISRFLYTHLCSCSFFRTDTRKKLTDFDMACAHLTTVT